MPPGRRRRARWASPYSSARRGSHWRRCRHARTLARLGGCFRRGCTNLNLPGSGTALLVVQTNKQTHRRGQQTRACISDECCVMSRGQPPRPRVLARRPRQKACPCGDHPKTIRRVSFGVYARPCMGPGNTCREGRRRHCCRHKEAPRGWLYAATKGRAGAL